MNETQTCGLCGADAELKYRNYPGYQEPDTFDIFHCSNCNTAFPFPVGENVDNVYDLIYENKSKIKGYNRYFRYSKEVKLQKNPFRYLAFQESAYYGVWKTLNNIPNPSAVKVLEVGSGLGYLTYSLKKAGFDAFGIDISNKVITQATIEFGENYKCLDILNTNKNSLESYDFIVLTEVIEHIPKPVDFIRTLLSLLSKNGKLIVTTPNKGIYGPGTIWASDIPPVHLWWLSEKSMKVISDITQSKVTFLTFEDFYKENLAIIDVGDPNVLVLPSSIFNKKGEVKFPVGKSSLYEQFKIWVFSKKILLYIYSKYRILRNPNIRQMSSGGVTICAIFEK
jgi:2-polyprenyl-3-methyl-5-hydroxy-6-metoxy-1,4-benzoquinol methylase